MILGPKQSLMPRGGIPVDEERGEPAGRAAAGRRAGRRQPGGRQPADERAGGSRWMGPVATLLVGFVLSILNQCGSKTRTFRPPPRNLLPTKRAYEIII